MTVAQIIDTALARDELLYKAILTRPPSLSAFLPYDEMLADSRIVTCKDGTFGVVYGFDLLEHEVMTSPEVVTAVDGLKSWFTLPECCSFQVIYEQREIPPRDPAFESAENAYGASHPVSKMLFEARVNEIKRACGSGGEFSPVERRGFLAIRYVAECPSALGRFVDGFHSGEKTLRSEVLATNQAIRDFEHILKSFEANSRICLSRLDGAELLDVLRRFFNPKTYYERGFAPFNQAASISDQVIYSAPTLDHVGIDREGWKTRTLSLKTSPHYAYPGGMAYFTKLKFPFRIVLSFSFPSKARVKQFFDMKEFFLQNTPSARAKRQREEILEVQDRLVRDDRCLHMTFSVIVEGRSDDELDARCRELVGIFNNDLECECINEQDIGLGLCLNALPLNYLAKADHSTQRFIRILRSDAVRLLPVFDSFRGLSNPLQLYVSREGNLSRFSLLENETSNHTVVLADSGSGKSSFVIDCIQAAKRMSPEPLVFVIDKKSSYLTLSEYFDADLTVFDSGKPIPFSPFRGVFDEEKVAFLTNLIVSGIKLLSPSFDVESDHVAVITKAIRLAHEHKAAEAGLVYQGGALVHLAEGSKVSFGMDDVVTELSGLTALPEYERFSKTIEDVIQKVTPFFGDGIYSSYFAAQADPVAERSKLFYIYDLDGLDGDKTLQTLMTMAVVEEIRQIIKQRQGEGRQGYVVLEEMQMLGGAGNAVGGSFVTDAAQTFRKLGIWLISLTPRPQNYFETAVGQAMWGVADNFIFLQMSPDNVHYLKTHSSLLDEATTEIIKSLRTIRGRHADVFFTNKKKSRAGAFRFFQTPLDRWLAPTNAKAAREVARAFKRFGGEKWKALDYLAATYPNGDVS